MSDFRGTVSPDSETLAQLNRGVNRSIRGTRPCKGCPLLIGEGGLAYHVNSDRSEATRYDGRIFSCRQHRDGGPCYWQERRRKGIFRPYD